MDGQGFTNDDSICVKMKGNRTRASLWTCSLLVMLLLLGCLPAWGIAKEVQVSEARGVIAYQGAEKAAREAALRGALQDAIEQAGAASFATAAEQRLFQTVSRTAFPQLRRAVTHHRVLRAGEVNEGEDYEVVISARVEEQVLQETLQSLRQLQEVMSLKTVLVIYNPRVQGTLQLDLVKPEDWELVQGAMAGLNQNFITWGFGVVDPSFLREPLEELAASPSAGARAFHQAASKLAAQHEAHYLASFTLRFSNEPRSESVNEAKVTLSAKLFQIGTDQLVRMEDSRSRRKARRSTEVVQVLSPMLRTVAKEAGGRLAESLVTSLWGHVEDGRPLLLRVQGGSNRQKMRFRKLLKSLEPVTRLKVMRRNSQGLLLRVHHESDDPEELLEVIEEHFYLNPGFDGYELEWGQAGELLMPTLVVEDECAC